ncbi:MAG TPA: shikimate kinase [Gemmatimonadaceae bacterium]|nr:shikimate kinase [Gemmatimonadaceae bacterium]
MATFRTSQPGFAVDPALPHLVLVGLPGAGKSTIGRLAADRAKRAFLDFDTEIERRQGMPISQIFAERGEPAFRRMEGELTQELLVTGGMIVAPGGGWITDPANVALLGEHARLVWLKVKPEIALARIKKEGRARPLLMRPDPLAEIKKLLEQREALYARAQYLINTEMVSVEKAAERVAELATGSGAA